MNKDIKGDTLTKKFCPNILCPLARACCIQPNAPQGAGRFEDQRPTGLDPEIPECWRGRQQGTDRGMPRRTGRVATPDERRGLHTPRMAPGNWADQSSVPWQGPSNSYFEGPCSFVPRPRRCVRLPRRSARSPLARTSEPNAPCPRRVRLRGANRAVAVSSVGRTNAQ